MEVTCRASKGEKEKEKREREPQKKKERNFRLALLLTSLSPSTNQFAFNLPQLDHLLNCRK